MSSLTTALVTYEEFSKLPDPTDAKRYELHDGEVVLVPPARAIHLVLQMRILKLLRFAEEFGCEVVMEFPYKPALQVPVLVCRCGDRIVCHSGRDGRMDGL